MAALVTDLDSGLPSSASLPASAASAGTAGPPAAGARQDEAGEAAHEAADVEGGAVRRYEAAAGARVDALVQFQLFTIFFEAYCGLMVGPDAPQYVHWQQPLSQWATPKVRHRAGGIVGRWRRIDAASALRECVLAREEGRPPQYVDPRYRRDPPSPAPPTDEEDDWPPPSAESPSPSGWCPWS